MGMSRREYARHRGDMSAQAVQKAIASGRIPVEADGTIDPARADAALRANTNALKSAQARKQSKPRPVKEKAPPSPPPATKPKNKPSKPVSAKTIAEVRDILVEAGAEIPQIDASLTFLDAQTANEIIKAHTAKLKFMQMKGDLLPRAQVEEKVFRMARQERDAWMNWPARVSSMLAADLGVEANAMHASLERHVREHLQALSEPEADF
ncbi:MAG TPA: elements of external origin [Rhodospirillaceae bacterium]|nr:MAG: hypothetical protein A2018_05645 [Alphaproteobacteria bacterium GWF2_58_20]HAU28998.1 elements of external origin [Rhodospirillaceae bacterium]